MRQSTIIPLSLQVVQFHPNSNYVASGSSDMTVRLWDCVTGSQVRLMTGHKGPIFSLTFSTEGRFLASAGADHRVLVWDLAHGHLVAALSGHTANIHCLSFSRDGNILVSGIFAVHIFVADQMKMYQTIIDNCLIVRLFRQYTEIMGLYKIGRGDELGRRQRFAQSRCKNQLGVLPAT